MKTFLQMLMATALLITVANAHAQTSLENFTNTAIGSVPAGWTAAPNTDVAVYQRPGTCSVNDKGLLTPGVGKNAPTGFLFPITATGTASNDIVIKFSVFVFDANLKCSSAKPFPCPTYVKAYIVPVSWNDPLGTPTAAAYYDAQPNYQILYPNTSNTIAFKDVVLPAGVTAYRVLLNFKTANGSNCTSGGTKFVFDDLGINSTDCNNCAPLANADYFNADAQNLFSGSTSFKGNVYGGYTKWASEAPAGFEIASLTNAPAINFGTDYDLNNTSLTNAAFALDAPLAIETGNGCAATSSPGNLTFNADGTFIYAKGSPCATRVSFSYKLTTYANDHGKAFGTTASTKVTIDLPGQFSTLPVHFKSFTATRAGKQVLLKWETASEHNNKGFYLQRNSGGEWKDIALVFSKEEDGNSNTELAYSYTDLNPEKGIAQYRVLQVDFDGMGRYSETRAVQGETAGSKLTLFPNPSTTGTITLLFDAAGSRDVSVSDMSGRLVQQLKNVKNSSLEVKGLETGFYTIRVNDNATGTTSIEKVIIKKR